MNAILPNLPTGSIIESNSARGCTPRRTTANKPLANEQSVIIRFIRIRQAGNVSHISPGRKARNRVPKRCRARPPDILKKRWRWAALGKPEQPEAAICRWSDDTIIPTQIMAGLDKPIGGKLRCVSANDDNRFTTVTFKQAQKPRSKITCSLRHTVIILCPPERIPQERLIGRNGKAYTDRFVCLSGLLGFRHRHLCHMVGNHGRTRSTKRMTKPGLHLSHKRELCNNIKVYWHSGRLFSVLCGQPCMSSTLILRTGFTAFVNNGDFFRRLPQPI